MLNNVGSKAFQWRWWILAGATVLWLAGLVFLWGVMLGGEDWTAGILGTPLLVDSVGFKNEWKYAANALGVMGLMLGLGWLFLQPRLGWTPTLTMTGRPMKRAVLAAAFLAMLLTIALIAVLMELANLWASVHPYEEVLWRIWIGMGIVWIGWGVIFSIYWRQGDRYTQLGKMVRGLLAGSFLMFLVAVPVQMWSPRRKDCYCATGSYTAIVFAGIVMLWCFGPGIVLLFMREKYRAEKLRQGEGADCPKCGYDLRGTLSAGRKQCPECGKAVV